MVRLSNAEFLLLRLHSVSRYLNTIRWAWLFVWSLIPEISWPMWDLKKLFGTELSQQVPFRLMLWVTPNDLSVFPVARQAYWLPRVVCKGHFLTKRSDACSHQDFRDICLCCFHPLTDAPADGLTINQIQNNSQIQESFLWGDRGHVYLTHRFSGRPQINLLSNILGATWRSCEEPVVFLNFWARLLRSPIRFICRKTVGGEMRVPWTSGPLPKRMLAWKRRVYIKASRILCSNSSHYLTRKPGAASRQT